MTKILLIDVGNTSTLFAYADTRTRRILKTSRAVTNKAHLFIPKEKVATAVISSVVPPANARLKKALAKKKVRSYFLGKDIPVPIKNLYKSPKQVGTDRLVDALAGYEKYRRELVIIDFGTAITFNVVSAKGEYLGGAIAPGIKLSLDALFERTALLPKIELTHPKAVIGRETIESIRSGCSHGIGGLCDRLVDEIARSRGRKPLVIATGGYAQFMRRYCHSIQKIEPNLTLQGILSAYLKKVLT